MSNVYVHFSQISFSARYSVVNFLLVPHLLRFREVITCYNVPVNKTDLGESKGGMPFGKKFGELFNSTGKEKDG